MGETDQPTSRVGRRGLLRVLAMAGIAGQTLLRSGDLRASLAEAEARTDDLATWPAMATRTLGRTGHGASRLVFGCGATLSRRRADDLLHAAFDAGVNVFDVGTRRYYDDAEMNLAPFLRTHRDRVFLISKAMTYVDVDADATITGAQAREAARNWSGLLDDSLRELGVEHVDAYYLMAQNNPSVVGAAELYDAFLRARQAGKVSWYGLSSHQNTARVLEAATATGWFDLAMIAITPGGWYDFSDRSIVPGSPPMADLQPLLERARAAGMGLIGMKAGRFLAGRQWLGWGNPQAFDPFYPPSFRASPLSDFQRSYAFVLGHGLDAVNADMQTFAHLKENHVAAATSHAWFPVPDVRTIARTA